MVRQFKLWSMWSFSPSLRRIQSAPISITHYYTIIYIINAWLDIFSHRQGAIELHFVAYRASKIIRYIIISKTVDLQQPH